MSLVIRDAMEMDIPEILKINNHEILNSTVNYDYEPKSLEFQMDWFHQKTKAGFPILVAEKDGKVIGFATYGSFRPKPSYQFTIEHSVYLHPNNRGIGVGKLLMEKLILIAKNQGYHLMVGGIDANNLQSLEFHKKLGFLEVGRFKEVGRKFDQWLDLIFVQLPLE
ncbi:phosphinothricin acetyltransferase [Algoriphagus iocasae]|jgi:L-amino acid N-acyltransferase|uniref:Phosphinothricin acetyltransferase n=1 Tax=Algoriphagus iocasae TaxID=1836499 RepID=A0A841MNW8_9BACT|nr:GNAT family N-acetyltransferase [Algoriphagus iocasae]MBB6327197.1 phosphinothricin acetyltransferase [Algoriphagus iocasae]